jgi:hypothetical protein
MSDRFIFGVQGLLFDRRPHPKKLLTSTILMSALSA